MRKQFFIVLFALLLSFTSLIPAQAEETKSSKSVSESYIAKVKQMSDLEVLENLERINSEYLLEEPFSDEDQSFILALHHIEEEKKEITTYSLLPAWRTFNYKVGPITGSISYRWYSYVRTIITTGYYGTFHMWVDTTSRSRARLASISMSFQAYGFLGDGGIGKIKDYSDVSNFVISKDVTIYTTNFDTWAYSPVLYTTSKLTLKFTDASRTYNNSYTITVKD